MVKQIYNNYTEEDHKVWSILYSRIINLLPECAERSVLNGIEKIGFDAEQIPEFDELNEKLQKLSGWEIVAIEDMVPFWDFIELLASKKYPCRTGIRSMDQLEMLGEYDMFHDIVGHLPLLTQPDYSLYLSELAKMTFNYRGNEQAVLALKRMYWHTIQYGVIIAEGSMKIYGAHLLSSKNEIIYSLGAGVPKYDFNIPIMINTPYIKNRFQERYFVIDSYKDLVNNLPAIKAEVDKIKSNNN